LIQESRIQRLNDRDERGGRFVLYWMQASQRISFNHALQHAIRQANARRLPVVVVFGITPRFPEANIRHYRFMLEGLCETSRALAGMGIAMIVLSADPDKAALSLADDAALLIADRGYLRIQKQWRKSVAAKLPCPVIQVESDVVVPVETASGKEEYAAATIRGKITKRLPAYLVPLREERPEKESIGMRLGGIELADAADALSQFKIRKVAKPASSFRGGESEAGRLLGDFLNLKLHNFAAFRNDPSLDFTSHMSPYLHFGQISPLEIALAVSSQASAGRENTEAYLEELIVRRELSMNFVNYNPDYDSFSCLPKWAATTLSEHCGDERPYVYDLGQLESARTHDIYWNAAQMEMVAAGKMSNYMRMYWGKKILEWSPSPEIAYRNALALNNKYELDGRDPNSFAGVAWCFGKHDRPWTERAIFGKVRYMNDSGLQRKFDMESYVEKVESLLGRKLSRR